MIFREFGDKSKPVMILLHGGGLSWWSWQKEIERFSNKYFVIAPIIDGHGDDFNTTFVSIEESAKKVIEYIKENCNGKVFAICGLSIGAQITVEILSRESNITEYAVIESVLVYPMKNTTKFTVPMISLCYGLVKKRWYAKIQSKSLMVPEELFETYFKDSSRITKESLINITKSNGNYSLSEKIGETTAKVLILVGEKELGIMKKSAEKLHDVIKGSTMKVIPNSGHGEISLLRIENYLELVGNFFE